MAALPASSAAGPTESSMLANNIREVWREQGLTRTGTSINEAWTDGEERVTLSTEFNGVVCVDEIHGSLGYPIGHRSGKSALPDELWITDSTRDADDLLLGALFDQRKEGVRGSDRSDNVGLMLVLHGLGVNSSGCK